MQVEDAKNGLENQLESYKRRLSSRVTFLVFPPFNRNFTPLSQFFLCLVFRSIGYWRGFPFILPSVPSFIPLFFQWCLFVYLFGRLFAR